MSYRGPHRVRITDKPVPGIEHSQDGIIEVTRSGICGSDIHLYNGGVPDTHVGMTLGHEVTGVVVDGGPVKVPEWMDLDDAVLLTDVCRPDTRPPRWAVSSQATPCSTI